MAQSDTLTRADLADKINKQIGLSRADAAQMVESLLGHVTDALYAGENVKISGFWHNSCCGIKTERVGRNPKNGD